jgi:hypothetical protein
MLAGMPERFPFIGLTQEWYSGPPVRLGDEYVQFRARTPWVMLSLRQDAIGEHARWAMKMSVKYDRPPAWRFWSIKDLNSPLDHRTFRLSGVDRALGRLVAYYAVWRAIVG